MDSRVTPCVREPERGHCWHTADGKPFARHNARPRGLVAVQCCYCGVTGDHEGFGRSKAPTMFDTKHGDALTQNPSVTAPNDRD